MCLDQDRLVSVTFTYANESGTQRRTLPRVGASGDEADGYDCSQVQFEDRSHMDTALVQIDAEGVMALQYFSMNGTGTKFGEVDPTAPDDTL